MSDEVRSPSPLLPPSVDTGPAGSVKLHVWSVGVIITEVDDR